MEQEVDSLDERIGGDDLHLARFGTEDGCVVADAHQHTVIALREVAGDLPDEAELAQLAETHRSPSFRW